MSSHYRSNRVLRTLAFFGMAMLAGAGCADGQAEPARELRVCSDPNNLPFSNEAGEGFENRIAELLAEELDAQLSYTWWAQRRGFFRNTLRSGLCDLVMGVPSSFELALPTRPYYRSTYVFVYPESSGLDVRHLDDARLRELRVGVQVIGDDYNNAPPAHALSSRGIIENVTGYTVYGDYALPNPPARIMDGLAAGDIDIAIVWGPLAGYFATQHSEPLLLVPVEPQIDLPFLPFVFDISLGVRRGEDAFRAELDEILFRRRDDIARILEEYRVPQVDRRRRAVIDAATPGEGA
jgi:mxaJ protein